ncbi:MAG: hypothetical protein E6L06_11145 [Verrucomicrobia bacterium]|nr:MAG: hypothetical protein E6L06_11145 [Verrucomicrobiota bacterium]
MQPQIRTFEQQVSSATIWRLFSPEDSETVHLNMSEQGNGQFPLAKRTVRNRDSSGLWEQIKTAYARGIGLREIARNMGIPAGTVLARANREGWSRQRDNAKALAKRDDAAKAITPFEAASATMQQRGERHLGRMANIVEKTVPHVEAMEPGAILDRVDDVERLDKVARRTFGISEIGLPADQVMINIAILGQ